MKDLVALLDPRDDDDTTVAVHSGDREITRAALRTGADALAATLRAAGLAPGQAVAVMPGDPADAVAALFGVWRAGGVYVPLNPRLSAIEVARVLDDVRPALVVAGREHAGRFRGHGVLAAAGPAADPPGTEYTWDPPDRPADPDAPARERDIALIQFTSGTTGRPKPVLLRHSGILELLEPVLAKIAGDGAADRLARRRAPMPNIIPTSLSLWAGIYNVLFAFRVGAPVVLMERFDTTRFAGLVARFGIRSVVLPPAAMVMLTDDPSVTSLEPLRYVRSITAPLSPLQARRFRDRFGITVLNCYGQTEIGGEIVGWNAADARAYGDTKLGAAGRPHDGVTLRIVGGDGGDAPTGTEGELWVRTPALAAGYAGSGDSDNGSSDLGDRLAPGGWFRTGDIASVDAEGFLWIAGRVSDMINRGGLKVFPAEIAEVLRLDPSVADCAVVGVPDDRLGEVPWAFVVPRSGPSDPAALEALCRAHLAPYKVPAGFSDIGALPRNEVGKVRSAELVALASSARPKHDAPTQPQEESS